MKLYGLRLQEGGKIENLIVPTGTEFPSDEDEGELFFLKKPDNTFGLYVWYNNAWRPISTISYNVVESTSKVLVVTSTYTGFNDTEETEAEFFISFDESTRLLTITPALTSFSFNIQGVSTVITQSLSITIPDQTGTHYVYFNQQSQLETSLTKPNIRFNVEVAVITWDSINQTSLLTTQKKSIASVPVKLRTFLEDNFGIYYNSGLQIINHTIAGDGSLDTHTMFGLEDGEVYDSLLSINIRNKTLENEQQSFVQPLNPYSHIPLYYRSGTGTWIKRQPSDRIVMKGTNLLVYNSRTNNTWGLSELSNGRQMSIWVFATNDVLNPIISILGQHQSNSISADTNDKLRLGSLFAGRVKILYRLIFDTRNTYINVNKAALQGVQDLRQMNYTEFNFKYVSG